MSDKKNSKEPAPIMADSQFQLVTFHLGEELYGVNIMDVKEIVRLQNVRVIPNAPYYVEGIINLRGEIVPIMNLRMKMGLEEIEETKSTRFIIIKMEKYGKIGLIVDAVKEVVALTDDQIERTKYEASDETVHFVFGVGKVDSGLVSLLDLDTVTYDKSMKEE